MRWLLPVLCIALTVACRPLDEWQRMEILAEQTGEQARREFGLKPGKFEDTIAQVDAMLLRLHERGLSPTQLDTETKRWEAFLLWGPGGRLDIHTSGPCRDRWTLEPRPGELFCPADTVRARLRDGEPHSVLE